MTEKDLFPRQDMVHLTLPNLQEEDKRRKRESLGSSLLQKGLESAWLLLADSMWKLASHLELRDGDLNNRESPLEKRATVRSNRPPIQPPCPLGQFRSPQVHLQSSSVPQW